MDDHWPLVTALWLLTGLATLHPRVEDLMALWVYRLRALNAQEQKRIEPVWLEVCHAAGVHPNAYRVWIFDGYALTAPATAGRTVAVTSWAVQTLPPRLLRAVLAHELAHHLGTPPRWSVLVLWYSIPARAAAVAMKHGWPALKRIPALAIAVLIFFTIAISGLVLWMLMFGHNEWDQILILLSPIAAPPMLAVASYYAERYADRQTAEIGYGLELQEIFYGWIRQGQRNAVPAGHSGRDGGADQFWTDPGIARRLTSLERHLGEAAYRPFGGPPGRP